MNLWVQPPDSAFGWFIAAMSLLAPLGLAVALLLPPSLYPRVIGSEVPYQPGRIHWYISQCQKLKARRIAILIVVIGCLWGFFIGAAMHPDLFQINPNVQNWWWPFWIGLIGDLCILKANNGPWIRSKFTRLLVLSLPWYIALMVGQTSGGHLFDRQSFFASTTNLIVVGLLFYGTLGLAAIVLINLAPASNGPLQPLPLRSIERVDDLYPGLSSQVADALGHPVKFGTISPSNYLCYWNKSSQEVELSKKVAESFTPKEIACFIDAIAFKELDIEERTLYDRKQVIIRVLLAVIVAAPMAIAMHNIAPFLLINPAVNSYKPSEFFPLRLAKKYGIETVDAVLAKRWALRLSPPVPGDSLSDPYPVVMLILSYHKRAQKAGLACNLEAVDEAMRAAIATYERRSEPAPSLAIA